LWRALCSGRRRHVQKIKDTYEPMSSNTETRRHRILIVEDDADTASMLLRAFADEYEVTLARDGAEGLEMALEAPHPDLVITDLMMPRLDGAAMAREVRAKLPLVTVIMLTAQGSSAAAVQAIQAGVRRFVHKPVSLAALKKQVRTALDPRSR
jgi:DNA-binding response OmpR family regulator